MRHLNRQRHQLFRLVARVAKHETLVARATRVHAHRDVRRLRLNRIQNAHRLGVITHVGTREPDVGNHFPRNVRRIEHRLRRDLAADDAQTRGNESLASHARHRIVFQARIKNRVRDLVGHLIGMSFGHRLGSKNMSQAISSH